jgi:hypothetical protein
MASQEETQGFSIMLLGTAPPEKVEPVDDAAYVVWRSSSELKATINHVFIGRGEKLIGHIDTTDMTDEEATQAINRLIAEALTQE